MTDDAFGTRARQNQLAISAQMLLAVQIAVACTVLSVSAILWAVWYDVNPAPSQSEFFTYSWIYGIQWGDGETVFQRHSQLLFPIYAVLNKLFIPGADPTSVFRQWKLVSQDWPAFLVIISLGLIYSTVDRRSQLSHSPRWSMLARSRCSSIRPIFSRCRIICFQSRSLSAGYGTKAHEDDLCRVLPLRFFL